MLGCENGFCGLRNDDLSESSMDKYIRCSAAGKILNVFGADKV